MTTNVLSITESGMYGDQNEFFIALEAKVKHLYWNARLVWWGLWYGIQHYHNSATDTYMLYVTNACFTTRNELLKLVFVVSHFRGWNNITHPVLLILIYIDLYDIVLEITSPMRRLHLISKAHYTCTTFQSPLIQHPQNTSRKLISRAHLLKYLQPPCWLYLI